ncbi:thiosulfate dehydrogenase [quinone] large subunit [Brevibacillus sp. 1238]|uniref:DoxX family protein n=1 Tax=Brevibacillus parabrevis TaxID=54914 RepID=A0A4Y3PL09_BREPA|nr:thiosulfate dehydrogenase [quinone] large subunit [Brevibacillus sp. 1238]GEB31968.1 hypothetical protein BPA01_15480 [Brevibacillus parabrevis]
MNDNTFQLRQFFQIHAGVIFLKQSAALFKLYAFPYLVLLMRILFGVGWFLAGLTKITEKSWYSKPGIFLHDYLVQAAQKPQTPDFYKVFINEIALNHVMFLNYVIPVVQIAIGILLMVGLFIKQDILFCLFMHINFILSGNMNLTSLVLYTSAFGLLLCRSYTYAYSLDRAFGRAPSEREKDPALFLSHHP